MPSFNKIILILLIMNFKGLVMAQTSSGEDLIKKALKIQELNSWQQDIVKKETKDILDYYLLLPKSILEIEMGINNDTKEFRLQSANNVLHPEQGRINRNSGFLIASPDIYLVMALFKDRIQNKDIIGIVIGCGMPPVQYCDFGFLEFDNKNLIWKINNEVFPWAEFYQRCEKIKIAYETSGTHSESFLPNIQLPEFGTRIKVFDAWDLKIEPVFNANWNGKEFIID